MTSSELIYAIVVGVVFIQAEGVVAGNVGFVVGAEFSAGAGVPAVPLKLLGNDFDDGGLFFAGELVHRAGPHRQGEADEQHGLNNGHDDFQVSGGVGFGALVIGLGIELFAETHQHV